jgi:hypothetical protein
MARFGPAMEPKLRPVMEWLGWGSVAVVVASYLYLR